MSGRLAAWLFLALLVVASPAEACSRRYMPFFADGSDGIQDRAAGVIEEFVRVYRDQRPPTPAEVAMSCGPLSPGNYVIVLLAHANDAGAVDQCALSRRRGEAVRQRLVELGLTEERILVVGRGDAVQLNPVGPGNTSPENRRVEMHFIPPDLLEWFMSGMSGTTCEQPGSR